MRTLVLLLTCAAFAAGARAAEPAAHPDLVSFADMVRLSAGAPAIAEPAGAHAPLRVSWVRPLPAEPSFSVRAVREPGGWLLVLSGLMLAGWVAHRRLVSPL